jgi:undecaprenyl-diphosphatase
VILFAVTFCVFYFIANEISLHSETPLDVWAYKSLKPFSSTFATKLMIWITFFGSTYFLFPCYFIICFYCLFIKKNIKQVFDVAIIGVIGNRLLDLMKYIFQRHRPLDPLIPFVTGYSFPSGHSFSAFTFFGLLTYLTWQTQFKKAWKILLSILFFLIAALIAISRVYLHVHYASDVLGGFCLSMMWLILSIWLLHKADNLFRKRHN